MLWRRRKDFDLVLLFGAAAPNFCASQALVTPQPMAGEQVHSFKKVLINCGKHIGLTRHSQIIQ